LFIDLRLELLIELERESQLKHYLLPHAAYYRPLPEGDGQHAELGLRRERYRYRSHRNFNLPFIDASRLSPPRHTAAAAALITRRFEPAVYSRKASISYRLNSSFLLVRALHYEFASSFDFDDDKLYHYSKVASAPDD